MKREFMSLLVISFLLSFMSLILMGMSIKEEMKLFSFFSISLVVSLVSFIYSLLKIRGDK
jgi:hypothetical protein